MIGFIVAMNTRLRKHLPTIGGCLLIILGTGVLTFGSAFAFMQEHVLAPWKSGVGGLCVGLSFVLYYLAWCLISNES